ncbi:MAG: hypothetical protein GY932_14095, partial [Arcobacter sp.]|nr:hypothetical protein [Arcobacter sp.]
MQSVNNDFSFGYNQANMRNTSFLDIIEPKDLSSREKIILKHIETSGLMKGNKEIICSNIVDEINKVIDKVNDFREVTTSECKQLNEKVKHYYQSSFFNLKIPLYGILNSYNGHMNKYVDRITFKDRKNYSDVFKSFKKIARFNHEMEYAVNYMDADTLNAYCEKVLINEKTILSKRNLFDAIYKRAEFLGIHTLASFKCKNNSDDTRYNFTQRQHIYENQPSAFSLDLINTNDRDIKNLEKEIEVLKKEKEVEKEEKDKYVKLYAASCPGLIECNRWQRIIEDATEKIKEIVEKIKEKEKELDELKNGPPKNIIGITRDLEARAIENNLYELINRINLLDHYINDYILNKGVVPSSFDALKIALSANYNDIGNDTWENPEIYVNIDEDHYTIEYSNLGIDKTKDNIKDILKNNVALKQNSLIFDETEKIVIPMSVKTIKFLERKKNRGIDDLKIVDLSVLCDGSATKSNLLHFDPDGSGFFTYLLCRETGPNNHEWERTAHFNQSENESRIGDNNIHIIGNKYYEKSSGGSEMLKK